MFLNSILKVFFFHRFKSFIVFLPLKMDLFSASILCNRLLFVGKVLYPITFLNSPTFWYEVSVDRFGFSRYTVLASVNNNTYFYNLFLSNFSSWYFQDNNKHKWWCFTFKWVDGFGLGEKYSSIPILLRVLVKKGILMLYSTFPASNQITFS